MGTWRAGNFDSDTASYYLNDFADAHLQPLVREIEAAMEGEAKYIEPDEVEGVAVMCRVEILCFFAEQIGCGWLLPEPEVVGRWSKRYLAVWDGYMNQPWLFEGKSITPAQAAKPGFADRRRAVIVERWDRLERLSRREHEGMGASG